MAASYVPKGLQSKADALLASIVPYYAVMPDGGLGFSGFGMKLYEDALLQLLDVGPSRNDRSFCCVYPRPWYGSPLDRPTSIRREPVSNMRPCCERCGRKRVGNCSAGVSRM